VGFFYFARGATRAWIRCPYPKKSVIKELTFQSPVERGLESVEQASKSDVKNSNRREPLGFLFFALVLFMVVYFARPQDWIPGLAAIHPVKITAILVLLALVFSFSAIRWHMPQEVIFLSLLLVHLWLTVPFSPVWRGGAFAVTLDFSKVLPLIIVIYATVRSMKRLRWILLVQGASVAAIAMISIVVARGSGERLRGVLSGVYGNSNDLALAIDLSLPLCLAFALTTRSFWKKLAWTIAMLAMVYAVFLTASRGGAIALVVVALVCLWQLGVKSRRLYLLLLVPVAGVVIWLYGGNALRGRFGQTNMDPATNNRTDASESAQQRKELLFQSLKVTAQHPLLGVGPGNFEIVSGVWRVTHNSYSQMSAEGGIPAFLLYVLILWRGIANVRVVSRGSHTRKGIRLFSMALGASLAAYLVGSFFASVAYQVVPYCLVAYTGVLRLIVQRDRTVSSWSPNPHPTPTEVDVTVWH
jgi:O-antigen ligase